MRALCTLTMHPLLEQPRVHQSRQCTETVSIQVPKGQLSWHKTSSSPFTLTTHLSQSLTTFSLTRLCTTTLNMVLCPALITYHHPSTINTLLYLLLAKTSHLTLQAPTISNTHPTIPLQNHNGEFSFLLQHTYPSRNSSLLQTSSLLHIPGIINCQVTCTANLSTQKSALPYPISHHTGILWPTILIDSPIMTPQQHIRCNFPSPP